MGAPPPASYTVNTPRRLGTGRARLTSKKASHRSGGGGRGRGGVGGGARRRRLTRRGLASPTAPPRLSPAPDQRRPPTQRPRSRAWRRRSRGCCLEGEERERVGVGNETVRSAKKQQAANCVSLAAVHLSPPLSCSCLSRCVGARAAGARGGGRCPREGTAELRTRPTRCLPFPPPPSPTHPAARPSWAHARASCCATACGRCAPPWLVNTKEKKKEGKEVSNSLTARLSTLPLPPNPAACHPSLPPRV